MRRLTLLALLGISGYCLNFLVLPAAHGSEAPSQNSSVSAETEMPKPQFSLDAEIKKRIDFLKSKLKLQSDQTATLEEIVTAHCLESYAEFQNFESQAEWSEEHSAKRRSAFETELRAKVTPQQYVQFLILKKKYYKKFPFGALI